LGSLPFKQQIDLLVSGIFIMSVTLKICSIPAVLLYSILGFSQQEVLSRGPATGASIKTAEDIPAKFSSPLSSTVSDEELGHLMMYHRRFQAAIEAFKKIESPSALGWNQIGIAYQMMYDYTDAIRSYHQALRLDPDDPVLITNLATAQDGLGDFGAAEKNYRKSLKLNPNSALTLKNLGTNLLMQHKYNAGAAAYKKALAADPRVFEDLLGFKMRDPAPKSESSTVAYFKARSCARAGLQDCAIAFLREAINEGLPLKQIDEQKDFAGLRNRAAYTGLIAAGQ
jgi:tetratricopeptide (TPR) repeat protein